jgi:hypothetical protein
MGVTHTLIFVPYFTSAGVKNGITLSSANLDQTYFEALTNQADRSLRWRPVNTGKKMESVSITRADAKYKEYPSGESYFIQSGQKTFEAVLPQAGYGLVRFFDSARCEKMGVFIVDRDGNLVGNGKTAGILYPFRIADQSINADVMHAQDGEVPEVKVRFNFDSTEDDADIQLIESSEMSYDVRNLEGLYDAFGVFTTISATGIVVDVRTHYGTAKNPNRVTGLEVGDYVLTNRGSGATVTITSVTESSVTPGIYTFVIPSQTSGHKLKLSFTLAGYDSNELSKQEILIP